MKLLIAVAFALFGIATPVPAVPKCSPAAKAGSYCASANVIKPCPAGSTSIAGATACYGVCSSTNYASKTRTGPGSSFICLSCTDGKTTTISVWSYGSLTTMYTSYISGNDCLCGTGYHGIGGKSPCYNQGCPDGYRTYSGLMTSSSPNLCV